MKNMKRVLAILGVVILLLAACLPMVFAFGTGENAQGAFRAALGASIMIPVLAYVFWLVYRVLGGEKKEAPRQGIRNIVFDLGNVLVHFDWKGYLDSFGFSPQEYEAVSKAVFLSPVWAQRDRSDLPEDAYVEKMVAAAPAYETQIRRVMAHSEKTIRQTDYAQTWVAYLKDQGYRIYILSNYARDTLDKTRQLLTFLPLTDGAVFSCEEKLIKPEPAIYERLLSRYGLKPEQTVFIDDTLENCKAAEKCGIHTIHFESFRQAAGELDQKLRT